MIKLVSIDLFETLVDLSGDRHFLWQKFLGDNATVEQTEDAWNYMGRLVYQSLDQVNASAAFKPLFNIFHDCFTRAFEYLNVTFDPDNAAQDVIDYHAQRPWFSEALSWLDQIEGQCRICLSSDTDNAMMGDHVRQYPFDKKFTSENLGYYKGDENNRFFDSVISYYGFDPQEILHVGDSFGEIIAAKQIGIQTCWINRNGHEWSKDPLPDYEVSSLDQINKLILNGAA